MLRVGVDERFDTVADLLRSFKALIDGCIFILLSRESDGALCFALIHTRLEVDHFRSFPAKLGLALILTAFSSF